MTGALKHLQAGRRLEDHPAYMDNAGGRARYAAKHAAAPRVRYERTEQGSGYTGPKTAPAPTPAAVKAANPRTFRAFRKVAGAWRAIVDLVGR